MINIGKQSARTGTSAINARRGRQGPVLIPLGFGCLYFLIICLCVPNTIKVTTLITAALALLLIVFRKNLIRERLRLPFLALSLFVIMDGISTFYAISGKFALREFLRVLVSFCLALIILCLSPRNEKRTGTKAASVLAVCGALGSLVSIDLISTRIISGALIWFLGLFTDEYAWIGGVEAGIRITSIFTSPNVFAGYSGLGMLLALGIAGAAEERKQRLFYLVVMYINMLAFLLAFSLGASIFLVIAVLVFLLLLPKEGRAGHLITLLESIIPVVVSTAVISSTSFREWSGIQPIPLICTVLGAAVFCLLDLLAGKRLTGIMSRRSKAVPYIVLSALVLIAVFLAVAWNVTGEIEISSGESLRRALYLEPGDYTLEIQADGPLKVRIESQNREETIMHKNTRLYNGAVDEAAFTVPENSLVQYFSFSTTEHARIVSASIGGKKIPLKYKLLPGFIANRLQGLMANENAIQRLVFFEDGVKLFRRSPLIGLGMGAYENGIKSVQPFYYETKYAHDHYIEVLVQVGIVGLVLFLTMLIISAAAVWRSRRTHPYAPVLGAALVFMAGHAAVEVVFSFYAYLPMAFGVFALIDLCCGEALPKPAFSKLAKTICLWALAACVFVYGLFLACNVAAKNLVDREPTLSACEKAVKLDKFEWADYALAYVTNTMGTNQTGAVRAQADRYAERLSRVNSNTIPIYLAQYYLSTNRLEKGLQMIEKYVDYVSSDRSAWQTAFDMLMAIESDNAVYRAGVTRIVNKLDDWNERNMGNIQLTRETRTFMEKYRSAD